MTQATHLVDMASAETALSGRPQLDEIEFAGATAYEAEPEIASATSALDPIYTIGGDKKSSGLRSVVLIAAFALIAGFGGWWFGARQSGTTAEIAAPIDVTSPTAAIDPEPRLDQATRPPADAETSQSGAKVESAANDSTAIDPSAIDPSAIDATGAEALETEPAPPPPPPPGRVTFLQPSWAPDMRVLFQGQNWPLPISREVDAGAYDATFVLDRPDYQQRRTVRVEIGAGQERNFSTTIPEPGQLDIRPGPRRPQGFVLIDNVEIGKTPIRDFLKEPGDYPIEIRPSDGSNGSALSSMIQIRPGQETIVTFDLMDGTITAKFKKSQEASTE